MAVQLHFNGINGATGQRLASHIAPKDLVPWIEGDDKHELDVAKDNLRATHENKKASLGLALGKNPLKLADARWGVIYAPGTPQAVREALVPLIAARKGKPEGYEYHSYERADEFRARHHQDPGIVNPANLPYYLLIVGSPEEIPFRFQYALDADHAVGRLCFDDPADYGRYVKNLLAYENTQQPLPRERRVAFFAPQHPGDESTALSALELAAPLAQKLDNAPLETPDEPRVTYRTEPAAGAGATKSALVDLLTRTVDPPALVFTASHGLAYPSNHSLQRANQGAIVCQSEEWPAPYPGPDAWPADKPLPPSAYLTGAELVDARFDGLVVFSFACYGAGTPRLDDFAYLENAQPTELAPNPFMAQLPQRLLAQGALAFIGHVDRAWGFSFVGAGGEGQQLGAFEGTLEAILKGYPIGYAFEYFNARYITLSLMLTEREEESLLYKYHHGSLLDNGQLVTPSKLAQYWIARNDARAYVILGDPYVSLRPDKLSPAA